MERKSLWIGYELVLVLSIANRKSQQAITSVILFYSKNEPNSKSVVLQVYFQS